jgi:fructose-bisphosphate aldolase class II
MPIVDFGDLVRVAREKGMTVPCADVATLADLEAALVPAEGTGGAVVLCLAVGEEKGFRALTAAAEARAADGKAAVVIAATGCASAEAATIAINAGCNGLLAEGAALDACRAVADTCGVTVLEPADPVLVEGGASGALGPVRPWAPVDHVIVYNVDGADDARVAELMAEGRRVLAAIPGVRWVVTGESVTEGAKFRFSWLVRFVHPDVISSYKDHPAHVAYADNWFRPVAGDRITIDFQAIGGAFGRDGL